jgi:hypothetical protein
MAGKDMFDYLKARDFSISEERAKQLSMQIVSSV